MKKVWCGNGGQDSGSLSVVQHSKLTFRPAPDGSNLSFKSKTIKGRTYWYLYVSLGRRRTEHYLGAETPELLEVLDKERGLWASTADDRRVRSRLVSMLLAGGATETRGDEGKVLALLERGGVFLSEGVLIGTIAFRAFANQLGKSRARHHSGGNAVTCIAY